MKWILLVLYEVVIISLIVWAIVLIIRSKKSGMQMADEYEDEIEEDENEETSEDEENNGMIEESNMLLSHSHIYFQKHVARDAKLVDFEADTLKNEILQCADGKISPEKAELLAYKCIARLDFDNQAAMSVPMDVRAELIVKNYLESNQSKGETEAK